MNQTLGMIATQPTPAQPPEWLTDIPPAVWLVVAIAIWLLFAWMVGRQAQHKQQSFWMYFIASLFFSPFALSLALHLMRDPGAPRG